MVEQQLFGVKNVVVCILKIWHCISLCSSCTDPPQCVCEFLG